MLYALCSMLCAAKAAPAAVIATPRGTSVAALSGDTSNNPTDYMTPTSFNMMEPFMNNTMRERLRPTGTYRAPNPAASFARAGTGSGITPAASFVPAISGSGRAANNQHQPQAQNTAQPRRVIQRPNSGGQAATTQARSAGLPTAAPNAARAAGPATGGGQRQTAPQRQVVPRATTSRGGPISAERTQSTVYNPTSSMSIEQCLAGYADCMDGYCARPNTAYNRCYCSTRLAQIDGTYRPAINDALRQIVILQSGGNPGAQITDAELETLWGETFAASGNNSMANLGATLSGINFSDFESRARGPNAFMAGHEYCMQHLPPCFYAAQNLLGIYRSTIAKDCAAYETQLRRTLTAAEAVLTQIR